MVIQRSSAPEIAKLADDLLGPNVVLRDAAAARLRVIGSRAVQRLLSMLRNVDAAGRETILRTLEGIVDARILPVATSLVDDEDRSVAAAALAVVQARLPDASSDAATRTIDALTRLVLDDRRAESLRATALTILEAAAPEGVQLLRERLDQSPNRGRRDAAQRPSGLTARPPRRSKGAQSSVQGGASRQPTPPVTVIFAAASGDLPAEPDELRVALHAGGSDVPLSTLHDVIVTIRQKEGNEQRPADRTAWAIVRAMAHQALAGRQSRVALYDLRETVTAWHDSLPVGFLQAMTDVGDASCLTALASAYKSSREPWVKQHIADACRMIVKREKLSRRHAESKRLIAHSPELAAEIWRT